MNAIGIIFSNIHDYVVPELTRRRAIASIPFCGRYRLHQKPPARFPIPQDHRFCCQKFCRSLRRVGNEFSPAACEYSKRTGRSKPLRLFLSIHFSSWIFRLKPPAAFR